MAGSFNELYGLGSQHSEDAYSEGVWWMQDDAASTVVVDSSSNGRDGTLMAGGANTSDVSTTGPNSWLTKSFALSAAAGDYIEIDHDLIESPHTFGFWFQPDILGSYTPNLMQTFSNRHYLAVTPSGRLAFFNSGWREATSGTVTTSWQTAAQYRHGSGSQLYLDSSQVLDTSELIRTDGTTIILGSRLDNFARGLTGRIAGAWCFSRELSLAEHSEAMNGPEPVYSSGVSFDQDGNYDVGTWGLLSPFGSGSNGSITYEVVAATEAGTVIDSTTGSTGKLNLIDAASLRVYLLVRASNDGGYDIGDKATRESDYGSSGDGYYELTNVVAASGDEIAIRRRRGILDVADQRRRFSGQVHELRRRKASGDNRRRRPNETVN